MSVWFATSITAFLIYLVLGIIYNGLKEDGDVIPGVLAVAVVTSFFVSIIATIIGIWTTVV